MDCVKQILFVLLALPAGQSAIAFERPPTKLNDTPPVHTLPSQSGNRAPLIVNRDERSARPTDGTFGYDSRRPLLLPQSFFNRITHYTPDRRERGYKTEAVHLFDILAVRPIKKSLHPEKHEEEHEGHGEKHEEKHDDKKHDDKKHDEKKTEKH